MRDRFNEQLEDNPVAERKSGGIHHRTLKQLKQAHDLEGGPGSVMSGGSKARSIFSRGNIRRHTTHEKADGKNHAGEDLNDKVSVIT